MQPILQIEVEKVYRWGSRAGFAARDRGNGFLLITNDLSEEDVYANSVTLDDNDQQALYSILKERWGSQYE